ncbi:type II toxin-antitoxin system Phd/YefM family antitoxin [Cellulomonas sp. Leaf334]|uniref:type II toxin-antitoxin system Phd/YefM family antitoxin n=1 Tax=Cellulomonas sp. Leaf334 TaxID=1736339 RepID=UPI0006F5AC8F|nr:type II toxin-antitoxin system Phd/YefM family antitoxin [Cellulomonas sp. Leaf334]KQR17257.1 hypothetical protein ASF78_08155 [Cellulomonas sp. Leaf334]
MITVSVTEARRPAARLLEHVVATGELVVITYRNRPAAVIAVYPWYAARTVRVAQLRELVETITDPSQLANAIGALPAIEELEAQIQGSFVDAEEPSAEDARGGRS